MESPLPISDCTDFSSLNIRPARDFPSLMDGDGSVSTVADRVRRYSASSTVVSGSSSSSGYTTGRSSYSGNSYSSRDNDESSSVPGLAIGTSLDNSSIMVPNASTRYENLQSRQRVTWEDESDAFSNITDIVQSKSSSDGEEGGEGAYAEQEEEVEEETEEIEVVEDSWIHVPTKESPATPNEFLFVQLCFYGRLGFVQPPCCLRCTYQEAMEDGDKNSECKEWTIWRKDATIPLHPERLEKNIVMVQCRAAQKLVDGEIVQGYSWNAKAKQLVDS